MAWKQYQTAAGYNSLENFELEADAVPTLLHQLKFHFQERMDAGNRFGLEALSSTAVEISSTGFD